MQSLRFIQRLVAIGTALLLPTVAGNAYAQPVSEAQMKVALIYNFAMFTDWPPSSLPDDSPLGICIAANSELRDALLALEARSIGEHRLEIRQFSSATDIARCGVLYIDHAAYPRWPQIRKRLAGKSVLTIADSGDIDSDGFMIALSVENGRMVFDVNSTAARDARLLISSKLLRLARKVYR